MKTLAASTARQCRHAVLAIASVAALTPLAGLADTPRVVGHAPTSSSEMMSGFESFQVKTSAGIVINGVVGGDGPPILLLHGAPVNLAGWRKVAPDLAKEFTVVATDLRGYGDSDMPEGGENHVNYSKRVMAQDQIDVMTALGFELFDVVGHDRGGRVGHRLAIDHPDRVRSLTVMDIMPTLYLYEHVDRDFAEKYWFWFFLTAPHPVPETFVKANPRFYMNAGMFDARKDVEDAAFENFVRTMSREGAAHAQSEDYRAAADIDLEHDRADLGDKLQMPLLVLWGDHNAVNQGVDIVSIWKERADDVRGHGVPSGHWIPEQVPRLVVKTVSSFISSNR